mmetsp:Transcript_41244/g.81345  ORF Transcript_41244/g.81345 Transcript_41244/m.81345 type:complete len:218 (+) Transcript_41244:1034-1687(+)
MEKVVVTHSRKFTRKQPKHPCIKQQMRRPNDRSLQTSLPFWWPKPKERYAHLSTYTLFLPTPTTEQSGCQRLRICILILLSIVGIVILALCVQQSLPVLLLGLLEHLLVCHQHLERLAYLSDGVGPQWPLGLDKADDLPNHWRLGTPGSDHSACLEVKLRPTIGVRDGALNDFAPLHGSLQDRGVVADTDDRAVFIRSDEEVETTNSHGDGLTRGDF